MEVLSKRYLGEPEQNPKSNQVINNADTNVIQDVSSAQQPTNIESKSTCNDT